MPLTRISSRPPTPLAAFTYRELLTQRRLAERAARRGRPAAPAMLARIEAELDARRTRKLDRLGAAAPAIVGER